MKQAVDRVRFQRRGATIAALRGLAVVGLLTACSSPPSSPALGVSRAAIIDGTPAPERTGVVHVAHPQSSLLCSGTVVAPTLMLTTKHCILRSTFAGYEALAADQFRIGFGPDIEHLDLRTGSELRWVGGPDDLDVETSLPKGPPDHQESGAHGLVPGDGLHERRGASRAPQTPTSTRRWRF
jgi:hypothetical protein